MDRWTSEEELDEKSLQRSATKSGEGSSIGGSIRVKKSKDPMALFEKRMTSKLKT